jgi:hypothetical protein
LFSQLPSAPSSRSPRSLIVLVLVLDFLGRGKRTDCWQRSKIENEDDDENEDD